MSKILISETNYPEVGTKSQVLFLPADFLYCKFDQLQEEFQKDECITWDNFKDAKKGDICYFYYKHLPSATGYDQSRILLRGVVKGRRKVEQSMVKFGEKSQTGGLLVDALVIGDLQPIALNDYKKFSLYALNTKYSVTQFHKHRFGEKERELFKDLEDEAKNSSKGKGFEDLIKYFEIPCAFEATLHPNARGTRQKDPLTFARRSNGLRYYEKHHFVQQHSTRKIQNADFIKIVDHDNNLINLCPYCHRMIHHGTPEVVSKMVEELYRQTKPFLDEFRLADYIDNEDPLTWLKQMYMANNEQTDAKKQDPHSIPKDIVE